MRKSRLFSRTGLISLLAAALTALGVSSPALALDNSGGIGGGAGGRPGGERAWPWWMRYDRRRGKGAEEPISKTMERN